MSESTGGTPTGDELVGPVREYCRRRHQDGNAYVSATQIVNEFDVTPQKAGVVLAKLRDSGDLDVWKDQSKCTTYRIDVDGTGDD